MTAKLEVKSTTYFVEGCNDCQQCLSYAYQICFHFRLGIKKAGTCGVGSESLFTVLIIDYLALSMIL